MGQKIHPIGLRMGQLYTWSSRWMAKKGHYKELLLEDIKLRKILMTKLKIASVAKVEIERSINKIRLIIHVARPGIVIGRGGSGLTELKQFIMKELKLTEEGRLDLQVEEIKKPELNAYLVATNAADQLAKRMPSRRIMNQTLDRVTKAGAKGVRIVLAGRINGAEIARREQQKSGSIPLHTLRANIDFAAVPAFTRSGYIGVKVWINKG